MAIVEAELEEVSEETEAGEVLASLYG